MLKYSYRLLRMAEMCTVSMAEDNYLDVTVQLWMARNALQLPGLATVLTSNLPDILCIGETSLASSLPSKIIA